MSVVASSVNYLRLARAALSSAEVARSSSRIASPIAAIMNSSAVTHVRIWWASRFRQTRRGRLMRHTRSSALIGALSLIGGVVVLNEPTIPSAAAVVGSSNHGGVISIYTGSGIDGPQDITVGPDGAMWFTNEYNNSIGRITTAGTVSKFTDSTIDAPVGITSGPDGALWFTNSGNNSIGRITTSGAVFDYTGIGIDVPQDITVGPDGALWFTNFSNDSIGRITTAGTVSNYTGAGVSAPWDITNGPDGALWFTNQDNNSIGRITTAGTVSNYTNPDIDNPHGITTGPDGALWFTNVLDRTIGRITTSGVVSTYAAGGGPAEITVGPDGALWFANVNGGSIGRITADGVTSKYKDATSDRPWGITAGPDGALWFTNWIGNSIGRITAVPSVSVSPSSGIPGVSVVVSGEGYAPGEQVNAIYKTGLASPSTVAICSASANPDGTFSCGGSIPTSTAGAAGDHKIKAKGMTSRVIASTTFTLTPMPGAPLSPSSAIHSPAKHVSERVLSSGSLNQAT